MTIRRLLSLSTLVLAMPALAAAQEHGNQNQQIVTMQGEGVVKRAPDRAWVTVGIEARARTSKEAQQQAAATMNAIVKALRAQGLDEDDIRTTSYNVNPEWEYRDSRRRLIGYVASNHLEVTIDDLAKVGPVIDAASEAGANNIGGVRFGLKDREQAEMDALARAVKDAQMRAKVAVEAAGRNLGQVVRIDETGRSMPPPMPMRDMLMAKAESAQAEPTPIDPGEIEIRVNVSASFAIR